MCFLLRNQLKIPCIIIWNLRTANNFCVYWLTSICQYTVFSAKCIIMNKCGLDAKTKGERKWLTEKKKMKIYEINETKRCTFPQSLISVKTSAQSKIQKIFSSQSVYVIFSVQWRVFFILFSFRCAHLVISILCCIRFGFVGDAVWYYGNDSPYLCSIHKV